MHSSRMGTARSSSRLLGAVWFSACWDPPPPGVGLETTPLGVGLKTPNQTPFFAPGAWAWRPPNPPTSPGCGPGDPPNLPPGCGPGDPPQPDPSTSPLGVGLETPMNRMTDRQV